MLQAIRSKATSFLVKILFGLLIVTFGVWGIGDIFRNGTTDNTVAKVGDRTITVEQMSTALQTELQRLQQQYGRPISAAQAKQAGLVDGVLQRLVDGQLANLAVEDLKLRVSDDVVRQQLIANPNFRNAAGLFDRNTFLAALQQNHMSEAQFVDDFRADILRGDVADALAQGMTSPPELVKTLYGRRYEHRVADTVTLPPSAAGTIAAPTEEQIGAFYKSHEDRFKNPERRSFTVALLTVADAAAGITVPDDKLHQEFQARQGEFNVPEQRQFQQMLLPDEVKAKDAAAQLAAGKDFAEIAKAETNADPQSLDLGWVKQTDLPEPLVAPAYALKVGETTQPIHTEFGWHILKLVATKPPTTQTFDQAKDALTKEVQLDMAGDQVANAANQIDDAIAGGTAFADIVQKYGLKTVKATNVNAQGQDTGGKIVELPQQQSKDILHAAFTTDSGKTTDLLQLGEDGYYVLQVDQVTPASTKPLTEVHDVVAKEAQDDERSQALAKAADAIASEVSAGRTLKQVAEEHKLTVATTEALTRSGSDAVPRELVSKLFNAKTDQAVTGPAGDAYMIAQVTAIQPAELADDQARSKDFSQQMDGALQNDLLFELDQALRRKYPVEINQTNLDRVL